METMGVGRNGERRGSKGNREKCMYSSKNQLKIKEIKEENKIKNFTITIIFLEATKT